MQFHERPRALHERGLALLRRRQRRVAERAARMEILRHPGEAGGPVGAEPFELARHGDGLRLRVRRLVHAHRAGLRRQHQRGLDVAGVDAVPLLLSPERAVRIAEAMPADRHRQHAEPRAQIARHDFHGRDIAAVAGDQDQLAHAGARQALAELGPGRDRGRRRKRQRAGIGQMLGGDADPLHRQERHRQVFGQDFFDPRQIGFGDVGVDAERQMRPVLLDRGERQHGDPARGVGAGDVLPGHVHPVAFGQRHQGPTFRRHALLSRRR